MTIKDIKNLKEQTGCSLRDCKKALNGEHIAFYPTAKAAAQALGYKRDSHIGDCCKGRRNSCFGYKWKYVID